MEAVFFQTTMIGFVVFGPGVRQHIKVGAAGRVLTSSQKTDIEREEGWMESH